MKRHSNITQYFRTGSEASSCQSHQQRKLGLQNVIISAGIWPGLQHFCWVRELILRSSCTVQSILTCQISCSLITSMRSASYQGLRCDEAGNGSLMLVKCNLKCLYAVLGLTALPTASNPLFKLLCPRFSQLPAFPPPMPSAGCLCLWLHS